MSVLKFYADTHIDKQIALQLRQKGIDVIRCEDVGMATADDESHLLYAAQHQYALITKDADFREKHFQWLSEGKEHAGIFFCSARHVAAIGTIVNACYSYAEIIENGGGTLDDIKNEFFDISEG